MQELIALYGALPIALLVFVRIGALLLTAPVLGDAYLPLPAKILLCLLLTAVLAPLQMHAALARGGVPADGAFLLMIGTETMLGATLGFFAGIAFQAVRFGGDLINRYAGFSAAENFDPTTNATTSPLGDGIFMIMLLVFFAVDGHLLLIGSLAQSFAVIPLGGWMPSAATTVLLARSLEDMMRAATVLSFPVLSTILAITLLEGVISRAIPQINVLQVSFAVKIVLSLLVIYAGLPGIVDVMAALLGGMEDTVQASLASMRP